MTFRYCFKGPEVPSRAGGFWTKWDSNVNVFVIKNVNGDCTVFGSDGGEVLLDTEHDRENRNKFGNNGTNGIYFPYYYPHSYNLDSSNVRLAFCIIGERSISSTSPRIAIGVFNQPFGFFTDPNNTVCPVLESQRGIIYGKAETIFIDLENKASVTKVERGKPPFLVDANKDVRVGFCVYDPLFGESN